METGTRPLPFPRCGDSFRGTDNFVSNFVDNIDKEIVIIQKDLSDTHNKVEELRNDFKGRPPAKETYEHFNKYNVDFALMGEELKNLTKTIKETSDTNAEQHREILKRVARIEQFAISILVIFALAALYFVFAKTGLKIP